VQLHRAALPQGRQLLVHLPVVGEGVRRADGAIGQVGGFGLVQGQGGVGQPVLQAVVPEVPHQAGGDAVAPGGGHQVLGPVHAPVLEVGDLAQAAADGGGGDVDGRVVPAGGEQGEDPRRAVVVRVPGHLVEAVQVEDQVELGAQGQGVVE